QGIDEYFDSAGGTAVVAVLQLLKIGARLPICGGSARYNDGGPPTGPDRLPATMAAALQKRIRLQGFIILDHYADRYEAFRREMSAWIDAGRIKVREHRVSGLEQAPAAFIDLLQGRNFGKVIVEIAQ